MLYADRVKDTTTTTGTGSITLAGSAPTGFRAFAAAFSVSDTVAYCIEGGSEWEVGIGTLSASTTLTRDTVLSSSNSGSLVSFSAGTKNVFCTVPATKNVALDVGGTITLPDFGLTSPATPTAAALFSRTVANRKMPAFVGASGIDSILQPLLARNKVGYWCPPGNATTVPGVLGLTALTGSGTATSRTVATTSLATRMRRLGYPSAATAGSIGGARIAAAQFSAGDGSGLGGFLMIERFVESDPATVSGRRAFAGMTSATGAPTNVEPNTLTNAIGIGQLSTDATQWYWIQGGSSAQTAVACGTSLGAPAGNSTTAWELAMFAPTSTANTFYLQVTNLTSGATATTTMSGTSTQVPQSSTLLAWRHWVTNNATALAVGVDFASIYIETDS